MGNITSCYCHYVEKDRCLRLVILCPVIAIMLRRIPVWGRSYCVLLSPLPGEGSLFEVGNITSCYRHYVEKNRCLRSVILRPVITIVLRRISVWGRYYYVLLSPLCWEGLLFDAGNITSCYHHYVEKDQFVVSNFASNINKHNLFVDNRFIIIILFEPYMILLGFIVQSLIYIYIYIYIYNLRLNRWSLLDQGHKW